jgi:putative peptidoglycan lipid II flippase
VLAFTVPNLFRRLLGEGALTAAFIPVFKEQETLAGEAAMWRAANAVLSGLVVVTLGVVAAGAAGVSVALLAGSFKPQTQLMLELLRLMFPYLVLVCVAAIFMGMLNARGYFFIPAMGAAMLNLVMIASVLWLAPRMGARLPQQVFGLALGVLAAGAAQALFQWPWLRRDGFRYRWISPWRDETVRRVVRQMIPGIIGVAAFQLNVLLTSGIAFWRGAEIIASFNYAVRLMELPQGLFGISLATFLLPTLSGLAAQKKYPEFRATLGQGLGYLVFINLLASVLLLTLAEPIMRLLFERGRFDAASSARAAAALVWLAPGLVAFSTVNILARAFYALGDLQTPMRISVFCLGTNVLLSAALIWQFRQAGLAAANSLTSMVNVGLLFYSLRRKLGRLDLEELRGQLPGLLGATMAAGAIAWGLRVLWAGQVGYGPLMARLGGVFVPMAGAAAVYFGLSLWLKIPFVHDLLAMLPRRGRRA